MYVYSDCQQMLRTTKATKNIVSLLKMGNYEKWNSKNNKQISIRYGYNSPLYTLYKYMGMCIGLPQNFLYYRRLLTLGSGCFCMQVENGQPKIVHHESKQQA